MTAAARHVARALMAIAQAEMRTAMIAAALLVAPVALSPWWPALRAVADTPAPAASLATLEIRPESAPAERLFDGTVEAVDQATVSAQTYGRVIEINYDVNDRVPAGAVILRIHSTEQVASLSQARAELEAASAREADAQLRFERISDMYERRVVAKATLDEARAARDTAVAQLAAARAGLDAAREGVSYTEIRAPYAGVVTQRHVQVGEAVAPGTLLMSGVSLDALRVVVEVPQSVVEQVRRLRKAAVYVDDRRIEAAGLTLFPSAQSESNTFRARIDLPKGVEGLAPGMFVKVGLVTGEAERLLVPRSAVVERSEMRGVYVVGPGDRVALRQVRLGRVRGDQVEILAGLAAGERIALDPAAAGRKARAPVK
jgi:RND family efflux transporter MFP subunit